MFRISLNCLLVSIIFITSISIAIITALILFSYGQTNIKNAIDLYASTTIQVTVQEVERKLNEAFTSVVSAANFTARNPDLHANEQTLAAAHIEATKSRFILSSSFDTSLSTLSCRYLNGDGFFNRVNGDTGFTFTVKSDVAFYKNGAPIATTDSWLNMTRHKFNITSVEELPEDPWPTLGAGPPTFVHNPGWNSSARQDPVEEAFLVYPPTVLAVQILGTNTVILHTIGVAVVPSSSGLPLNPDTATSFCTINSFTKRMLSDLLGSENDAQHAGTVSSLRGAFLIDINTKRVVSHTKKGRSYIVYNQSEQFPENPTFVPKECLASRGYIACYYNISDYTPYHNLKLAINAGLKIEDVLDPDEVRHVELEGGDLMGFAAPVSLVTNRIQYKVYIFIGRKYFSQDLEESLNVALGVSFGVAAVVAIVGGYLGLKFVLRDVEILSIEMDKDPWLATEERSLKKKNNNKKNKKIRKKNQSPGEDDEPQAEEIEKSLSSQQKSRCTGRISLVETKELRDEFIEFRKLIEQIRGFMLASGSRHISENPQKILGEFKDVNNNSHISDTRKDNQQQQNDNHVSNNDNNNKSTSSSSTSKEKTEEDEQTVSSSSRSATATGAPLLLPRTSSLSSSAPMNMVENAHVAATVGTTNSTTPPANNMSSMLDSAATTARLNSSDVKKDEEENYDNVTKNDPRGGEDEDEMENNNQTQKKKKKKKKKASFAAEVVMSKNKNKSDTANEESHHHDGSSNNQSMLMMGTVEDDRASQMDLASSTNNSNDEEHDPRKQNSNVNNTKTKSCSQSSSGSKLFTHQAPKPKLPSTVEKQLSLLATTPICELFMTVHIKFLVIRNTIDFLQPFLKKQKEKRKKTTKRKVSKEKLKEAKSLLQDELMDLSSYFTLLDKVNERKRLSNTNQQPLQDSSKIKQQSGALIAKACDAIISHSGLSLVEFLGDSMFGCYRIKSTFKKSLMTTRLIRTLSLVQEWLSDEEIWSYVVDGAYSAASSSSSRFCSKSNPSQYINERLLGSQYGSLDPPSRSTKVSGGSSSENANQTGTTASNASDSETTTTMSKSLPTTTSSPVMLMNSNNNTNKNNANGTGVSDSSLGSSSASAAAAPAHQKSKILTSRPMSLKICASLVSGDLELLSSSYATTTNIPNNSKPSSSSPTSIIRQDDKGGKQQSSSFSSSSSLLQQRAITFVGPAVSLSRNIADESPAALLDRAKFYLANQRKAAASPSTTTASTNKKGKTTAKNETSAQERMNRLFSSTAKDESLMMLELQRQQQEENNAEDKNCNNNDDLLHDPIHEEEENDFGNPTKNDANTPLSLGAEEDTTVELLKRHHHPAPPQLGVPNNNNYNDKNIDDHVLQGQKYYTNHEEEEVNFNENNNDGADDDEIDFRCTNPKLPIILLPSDSLSILDENCEVVANIKMLMKGTIQGKNLALLAQEGENDSFSSMEMTLHDNNNTRSKQHHRNGQIKESSLEVCFAGNDINDDVGDFMIHENDGTNIIHNNKNNSNSKGEELFRTTCPPPTSAAASAIGPHHHHHRHQDADPNVVEQEKEHDDDDDATPPQLLVSDQQKQKLEQERRRLQREQILRNLMTHVVRVLPTDISPPSDEDDDDEDKIHGNEKSSSKKKKMRKKKNKKPSNTILRHK